MDMNEYQKKALRTARKENEPPMKWRLADWSLGLTGETGEAVDVIKKLIFHGHFNKEKLKEELGDALWYIAVLAAECELTLEEIARFNVDVKLKERYPEGFDPERSRNR